jgi:hypothetical protein
VSKVWVSPTPSSVRKKKVKKLSVKKTKKKKNFESLPAIFLIAKQSKKIKMRGTPCLLSV